jgi:hypothetical protein
MNLRFQVRRRSGRAVPAETVRPGEFPAEPFARVALAVWLALLPLLSCARITVLVLKMSGSQTARITRTAEVRSGCSQLRSR